MKDEGPNRFHPKARITLVREALYDIQRLVLEYTCNMYIQMTQAMIQPPI